MYALPNTRTKMIKSVNKLQVDKETPIIKPYDNKDYYQNYRPFKTQAGFINIEGKILHQETLK